MRKISEILTLLYEQAVEEASESPLEDEEAHVFWLLHDAITKLELCILGDDSIDHKDMEDKINHLILEGIQMSTTNQRGL